MAEPKRVTRGWQVRYRTPDGASRKATFRLKEDAKAFQTKTENSKLDGAYVDRSKGRQLLGDYATDWLATRLHKPNTADRVESQVRVHIIPGLGHRPLAKVMPSEIQGFITKLDKQLAPGSVRNVYWTLQAIFNAAVSDRCIGRTPCVDVSLPRLSGAEIVPPTSEQAGLLIAAMPEKYRVAGWLAAGAGLRQGEVLGLTLDRVDFLRRQIVVDRQLITPSKGVPYLDDPKWESARTLPIPDAPARSLGRLRRGLPAHPSTPDLQGQAGTPGPLGPAHHLHRRPAGQAQPVRGDVAPDVGSGGDAGGLGQLPRPASLLRQRAA